MLLPPLTRCTRLPHFTLPGPTYIGRQPHAGTVGVSGSVQGRAAPGVVPGVIVMEVSSEPLVDLARAQAASESPAVPRITSLNSLPSVSSISGEHPCSPARRASEYSHAVHCHSPPTGEPSGRAVFPESQCHAVELPLLLKAGPTMGVSHHAATLLACIAIHEDSQPACCKDKRPRAPPASF